MPEITEPFVEPVAPVVESTPVVKDYLTERMTRGHMYDVMIRTEGWKTFVGQFKFKLKDVMQRIMTSDNEVETYRQELEQLRGQVKMLQAIKNDLETLNDYQLRPGESDTVTTELFTGLTIEF